MVQVEDILSDLIRIESVNPPGGETAVAGYLREFFDRHGIQGEVIESAPGRGSFIASIGAGTKSLLYLSHTDVVPVGDGWAFPPFSGEIKDGFVHGRGALDCKGLAAAEACALIILAQTTALRGRLIYAATADEETGGRMGVQYLVEHCPEKLRADFAVNEGAEAPVTIRGKPCHFVSVGEKGPSWLRLRTSGIAGHGSVPFLEFNAVVKMARVIEGLARYQPRVTLVPEVARLVKSLAELSGYPDEIDETNLDRFIGGLEDRTLAAYLMAITRMTVSPNVIAGGIKTNIVPDRCEAAIDIRVLPGQNKEYVLRELGDIFGEAEIEPAQYHAPTISPADTDAYRLITGTLREFIGDVPVLPTLCAGATDSRYLREMGVPSYGIGMMTMASDPALKASVHGRNEKLDIASLRLKTEFLVRLAKRYLGG